MDTENVPGPPSQSAPQKNILDFLMLIGKLKHLKRTGWVREKIPDCETVAGHMYRMGIMSFMLDSATSANINKDRCIKMSLVHDMAECIVGDLTPWCGVSKDEKRQREQDAMELLCSFVSEEVGKEFKELFQEYEDQQTVEAKAVKDLDRFDMILQAYEYETTAAEPISLDRFFASTEGCFRNQEVMNWVEELKRIRRMNLKEQEKSSDK